MELGYGHLIILVWFVGLFLVAYAFERTVPRMVVALASIFFIVGLFYVLAVICQKAWQLWKQ